MAQPMWTLESADIMFTDNRATIYAKVNVNFYVHALWPDVMREYLKYFPYRSLSELPWNLPLLDEGDFIWFPRKIFPFGPLADTYLKLAREWKSLYDHLYMEYFRIGNQWMSLCKSAQYGLHYRANSVDVSMANHVSPHCPVFLQEISLRRYRLYRRAGVDTFYWDEELNKIFILYGKGSLLNNDSESAATFMNWRNDGLVVKHIYELITYTEQYTRADGYVTVTSQRCLASITTMNNQEEIDHSRDDLKDVYQFSTADRNLLPYSSTVTYLSKESKRIPLDGCTINVSQLARLRYRTMQPRDQIYIDYNMSLVV